MVNDEYWAKEKGKGGGGGESAHINMFPAYSLPSQLLTLKRILHQQRKKDFGQ